MTPTERIIALCKEKRIPVYKLEKDLGFANGYIAGLSRGVIRSDRLFKIAEYLGVSPEYLQGEDEEQEPKGEPKKSEPAFYFIQRETAELAQELHDRPELTMLFKMLRKASPESLKLTAEVVERIVKAEKD